MSTQCPVERCAMPKEHRHAMCRGHWVLLSPRAQRGLSETYRRYGGRPTREFLYELRAALRELGNHVAALPPTEAAISQESAERRSSR